MTAEKALDELAALTRAMDKDGNVRCERCGARIAAGNGPEYHHNIEAAIGGPGTIANCIVLCRKPCHATITARQSIPQVAKTKRVVEKRAGLRKPKGKPLRATAIRPGNRSSTDHGSDDNDD